eukprot:9242037-Heterocapsa_arctica.AAC.1
MNDRSGRSGRTHMSVPMSRRYACCWSGSNFSLRSSIAGEGWQGTTAALQLLKRCSSRISA